MTTLAACLRKELLIRLGDPTLVVAMLFMPFVLLLLLTHALEGAFVPATTSDNPIPISGNVEAFQAAAGTSVETEVTSVEKLEELVRGGRRFFGIVVDEERIRIVADAAFPTAARSVEERLSEAGLGEVVVEDINGEPIEVGGAFEPFNYTVPGFTIMFLFFLAAFTGFSIYGDVVNGGWLRIQTSRVPSAVIVSAKLVSSVIVGLLQIAIVFTIGRLALGVDFDAADLPGMVIIAALVCLVATTFGIMLTGLTRTAQQMNLLNNLCLLTLASVGGAIVPIAGLPETIQRISFLTPHYWALRGLRDVMFRDFGMGSVPDNAWPLLTMAVLFFLVGMLTLRYSRLSRAIY